MRKRSRNHWFVIALVWTLLLLDQILGSSNIHSRSFVKTISCKLEEKLENGNATQESGIFRSRTECISSCRKDCLRVSMDKNLTCFHHMDYSAAVSLCDQDQSVFTLYARNPCHHDGIWNLTMDTCKCVDSWVGTRCERQASYCEELLLYGYPYGTFVVTMQLSDNPPFKTKWNCQDSFESLYIMYNIGNHDNNRTWKDYEDGFYDDTHNFWIGLKNIRALNGGGMTVALDTAIIATTGGKYELFGNRYNGFQLSGSPDYSFTYSSSYIPEEASHKNFGNCLENVQNTPFSTWDKSKDGDNCLENVQNTPSSTWNQGRSKDNTVNNCAASLGAGWWFGDGNAGCNPMAQKSLWSMDGFDLSKPSYVETIMYFTKGKTATGQWV